MRQEDVLEVELLEEARVGSEQGALGAGRVVHQTVGNEAGWASPSTADDAVGEGESALFGEVEGCLVGADATYLTSQHAAGQRVPGSNPPTASPWVNSWRPARWQCTEQPNASTNRALSR